MSRGCWSSWAATTAPKSPCWPTTPASAAEVDGGRASGVPDDLAFEDWLAPLGSKRRQQGRYDSLPSRAAQWRLLSGPTSSSVMLLQAGLGIRSAGSASVRPS